MLGSTAFAQGLNTTASKNDWEEINFEFNSSVLTDGYPSLLRLSELLQKHSDYKVKVEGHADRVGSNRYNDKLAQRRADTVKAFLVKYGAGDGQISTASLGKRSPKVENSSKEGRFMNRRVMMTLTDGSGKVISDGTIVDAINAMTLDKLADMQKKCCDDILKRLDRLDEIADMLKKMSGENDALRKEVGDLRGKQAELDAYVKGLPKPLTPEQTATIVDTRTAEQIEKARMPRFSLLGVNAGLDQNRDLTFTGRGRFFMPFKEQFAVQMQGEYMYFRDRQEGQADFGLVNRFLPRAQAGMFASFKHVSARGMQSGGTLGQASMTLDYLFSRGRFGVFGAKGFLNDAVLNRVAITRNIFDELYLRTIDQVGVSTTVGLMGNVYMEANLGYLKSRGNADRPGGTVRFVAPISDRFAFTLEGGMNESLVGRNNNGRVVAGLQFGNFMRPKDYLEGYNGVQHAVPADIPRVRYEMLTRRVRTGGNDAPVADAGPDQSGLAAGTVNLDASGSFDPDGDPITFQWSQIAGPAVSISGQNQARASFTAAAGQSYSFRVTVKDDKGAQGIARTTVTTTQQQQVEILRFQASPTNIRAGQSSTIDWQVLNADTVTITPLGNVDAKNGSRQVSPTTTTQYVLTARNGVSSATASTTVTVEELPPAAFSTCAISPMNIIAGESATINYATTNAETVTISGIGTVAGSGNRVVNPTQTTTYTLSATNARNTATCSLTLQVTQGTAPRVISFTAAPTSIQSGQSSTLSWSVENATSVSISTVGTVRNTGTSDVKPTQTTTYTLTAKNNFGEVSATTTVTVTTPPPPPAGTPVAITACTAMPSTAAKPGDPIVISYTATNATAVTIPGVSGATVAGPVTVTPLANTTYTITAAGANNTSATCTVAVTVTPAPPPVAIISGPSQVETIYRQLTIDGSQSTNPAGGALTYIWEPLSTGSAVLDQGQAQTRIQIGGLFGDYMFRLTVRNAAGQSDSTIVTVRFLSTNVF
ncbi:MAG TPA: OmpA family protein [Bryobacteraceae bacterium]|nr:OmpA family protein [Bryobacteraceae bacterium]